MCNLIISLMKKFISSYFIFSFPKNLLLICGQLLYENKNT